MEPTASPSSFPDHFSRQAASYVRHRPRYPEALFDWLATLAPPGATVWEVAAGNGQATAGLVSRFRRVLATEPSLAQLALAGRHDGACWIAATGEAPPFATQSADLVVVATAAHWLEMSRFAVAVRQVARPGAALVVWCYGEVTVTPAVDALLAAYRRDTIDPWWPPGREHVESLYRTLDLPFRELEAPEMELVEDWDLAQLVGYLDTWSALARYRAARGEDPLPDLARRLADAWGDPARRRPVRWPLALRASRVE